MHHAPADNDWQVKLTHRASFTSPRCSLVRLVHLARLSDRTCGQHPFKCVPHGEVFKQENKSFRPFVGWVWSAQNHGKTFADELPALYERRLHIGRPRPFFALIQGRISVDVQR